MIYLLDTNVASVVISRTPDQTVVDWIDEHEADCALSAVTFGEMSRGVELLPEGKRRRLAASRLKMFWEDFAGRILPVDDSVAAHWARYHTRAARVGHPPPLHDSWIAATADFFNLSVVTRNPRDFPLVEKTTI